MIRNFSRTQTLVATGAVVSVAIAASTVSLTTGNKPAQAQSGVGTFFTVIAVSDWNFNAPQVRILQTNNNDFARLRFSLQNQDFWHIATRFDRMNFSDQTNGNVMSLSSSGNLSIKGT